MAALPSRLLQPRLSNRLLNVAHTAFHRMRIDSAFVKVRRIEGAVILMYHGIVRDENERWVDPRFSVPARTFAQQMKFLARQRHVISMDALIDMLEAGRTPAAKTVAITFDDGYLSTYELAAPILELHRLPAIVYLATGYIESGESQWIDVLYAMFMARTRQRVTFEPVGLQAIALTDPRAIVCAYFKIADHLLISTVSERKTYLAEIREQLRPDTEPPRLTMTWADVHSLRREHPDFAIGVHTRDHIDLANLDAHAARAELERCIGDVRTEFGVEPRHLSYPYGRCSPTSWKVAQDCGLRSAAVTDPPGLVRSNSDRFRLPRIEAPRSMPQFAFVSSGAVPELSRTLFGRP